MILGGSWLRALSMAAPVSDDPFLAAVQAALPQHGFWQAPVVIGASGGADSTALLVALAALGTVSDGTAGLVVAHAEYDIRPEAAGDRDFVAALAEGLGQRFMNQRLVVREDEGHPRGEGLEARARRLRYQFFTDVARETGSRHVVVAHTADDQAETILQRILRGTGVAGLAGMAVARELCDGIALIRPLLGIRGVQVREWLLGKGHRWCEDATNRDTRHTRNFLRHEIIRRCAEGPYPAVVEALERLGSQAAGVSAALASAADYLLDRYASRTPNGSIMIDTATLATLDRHLVAEAMAALWRREGWARRDMAARHYERLVDMVRTVADTSVAAAIDLPGGVHATVAARRWIELRP